MSRPKFEADIASLEVNWPHCWQSADGGQRAYAYNGWKDLVAMPSKLCRNRPQAVRCYDLLMRPWLDVHESATEHSYTYIFWPNPLGILPLRI